MSSLLLCILNGSFGIGKGFGFQKEHDGSLIGFEDSIQQIHLAGVYICTWNIYSFCKIKLYDECKVDTSENFYFLETCFDGVWNQGERGIDCGGPCPPGGKLGLIKLFHPNHHNIFSEIKIDD